MLCCYVTANIFKHQMPMPGWMLKRLGDGAIPWDLEACKSKLGCAFVSSGDVRAREALSGRSMNWPEASTGRHMV